MNVARMKALRKSKGITQQQAAYDLGFSTQQRYNFYETGKREPDNETLKQLAEYFNVSADYLLGTTDDPTPPDAKKAPSIDEGAKMLEETIHSMGFDEITPSLLSAVAELAFNNKNLIRARAKEIEENGK